MKISQSTSSFQGSTSEGKVETKRRVGRISFSSPVRLIGKGIWNAKRRVVNFFTHGRQLAHRVQFACLSADIACIRGESRDQYSRDSFWELLESEPCDSVNATKASNGQQQKETVSSQAQVGSDRERFDALFKEHGLTNKISRKDIVEQFLELKFEPVVIAGILKRLREREGSREFIDTFDALNKILRLKRKIIDVCLKDFDLVNYRALRSLYENDEKVEITTLVRVASLPKNNFEAFVHLCRECKKTDLRSLERFACDAFVNEKLEKFHRLKDEYPEKKADRLLRIASLPGLNLNALKKLRDMFKGEKLKRLAIMACNKDIRFDQLQSLHTQYPEVRLDILLESIAFPRIETKNFIEIRKFFKQENLRSFKDASRIIDMNNGIVRELIRQKRREFIEINASKGLYGARNSDLLWKIALDIMHEKREAARRARAVQRSLETVV